MDKSNDDRLKMLIGFIREDKAKDMGNVEKAAADFLENNFTLIIGIAEAYDERDGEK
jgi:hypothetical protein